MVDTEVVLLCDILFYALFCLLYAGNQFTYCKTSGRSLKPVGALGYLVYDLATYCVDGSSACLCHWSVSTRTCIDTGQRVMQANQPVPLVTGSTRQGLAFVASCQVDLFEFASLTG